MHNHGRLNVIHQRIKSKCKIIENKIAGSDFCKNCKQKVSEFANVIACLESDMSEVKKERNMNKIRIEQIRKLILELDDIVSVNKLLEILDNVDMTGVDDEKRKTKI